MYNVKGMSNNNKKKRHKTPIAGTSTNKNPNKKNAHSHQNIEMKRSNEPKRTIKINTT